MRALRRRRKGLFAIQRLVRENAAYRTIIRQCVTKTIEMPTTGERFSLDVHNAGALGAGVQWARERLVEFTDDFWRPRPQSDSHGLQSANVIRLNLQVNLLLESFLNLVF